MNLFVFVESDIEIGSVRLVCLFVVWVYYLL